MAKETRPTRALLAVRRRGRSGVRDGDDDAGADPRRLRPEAHRFSWLTTGDLGWIQQSNMLLVGVVKRPFEDLRLG